MSLPRNEGWAGGAEVAAFALWAAVGACLAGITFGSAAAIVYVNVIALLPLVWPLAACSVGLRFFAVRLAKKWRVKRSAGLTAA